MFTGLNYLRTAKGAPVLVFRIPNLSCGNQPLLITRSTLAKDELGSLVYLPVFCSSVSASLFLITKKLQESQHCPSAIGCALWPLFHKFGLSAVNEMLWPQMTHWSSGFMGNLQLMGSERIRKPAPYFVGQPADYGKLNKVKIE